jgi:hypothetical protein
VGPEETDAVEDGGQEGGPEAEIIVLDQTGAEIRRFRGPAEPGLNRTGWDLRADLPGADEDTAGGGGGPFGSPRGPEVVPGSYTVRVELGGESSEARLELLPDPRTEIAMVDRIAKYEASMEAAELNQRLTRAQDRVREVEEALEQLLSTLEGMEGEGAEALRTAARQLQETVEEDVDFEPATSQRRGLFALQSSWDAPTTRELMAMERMENALGGIEADVNALIAGPVTDFRRQVEGTDLVLFPTFDPVGR